MLVLTRKTNERIFIGNDISIQITAIHGNQVRLGITAPAGCLILREEVKEQINGLVRQDQKKSSKKTQTKGTKNQTPKRR
jgi:carbon storage regulator